MTISSTDLPVYEAIAKQVVHHIIRELPAKDRTFARVHYCLELAQEHIDEEMILSLRYLED